jgi:hypothetical protein
MILNIGDCARRKLALARSSSVIPNRKVRCWRSQFDTNRSQRVPWSEWEKLGSSRQLRQYDEVVPLAENDGFDYRRWRQSRDFERTIEKIDALRLTRCSPQTRLILYQGSGAVVRPWRCRSRRTA